MSETRDGKAKLTEARIEVIREALRFADWAAGQGICPVEGEPCRAPEEFLWDYSVAEGIEDWEPIAEETASLLRSLQSEEPSNG